MRRFPSIGTQFCGSGSLWLQHHNDMCRIQAVSRWWWGWVTRDLLCLDVPLCKKSRFVVPQKLCFGVLGPPPLGLLHCRALVKSEDVVLEAISKLAQVLKWF